MQLSELKTVHVTGLEYTDTDNANSYFALEIVLNLDASRGEPKTLIKIPLQYGYEDQYIYEANRRIRQEFRRSRWYKEKLELFDAQQIYKFKIVECYKIKNCTKARIKKWYNQDSGFNKEKVCR